MKNMFELPPESHYLFSWDKLGNIKEGREHLGEDMPVLVYRLLEYSMNHVLFKNYGIETTNELFRQAGYLAGTEYAKNVLPLDADEGTFCGALAESLEQLRIGILRMEEADFEAGRFIIAVHEDLDCSGLPSTNEIVCNFDEGFLSGILEAYIHKPVEIREVECWASGSRVCRFKGTVTHEED